MNNQSIRIGFVSTRFAGTDGVSLETQKWAQVLDDLGHQCFYFAGESDLPPEVSRVIPEAHFEHPRVKQINADLFGSHNRSEETTEAVHDLRRLLKRALHEFVNGFGIQVLIVENALAIPMNIPLGLALTELLLEIELPTIAHHHDFTWERSRYAVNAAKDYLQAAFPPAMPEIHHVVINSFGATQLAYRKGMRSTLIPNVMDFDHPPQPDNDYAATIRQDLDIPDDDLFLLQPTRVVPRKRIERAIDFARLLERPCSLVVSHDAGDEGFEYQEYLQDYARTLGVKSIFAAGRFDYERGTREDGGKIYSLADAYYQADLVTYPSRVEGFGNAFLEAIYFRKPLVMSAYEIFKTDINPKGFKVIYFEEFMRESIVDEARRLLDNQEQYHEMIDLNYELGRRHYSFSVLRHCLDEVIKRSLDQTF